MKTEHAQIIQEVTGLPLQKVLRYKSGTVRQANDPGVIALIDGVEKHGAGYLQMNPRLVEEFRNPPAINIESLIRAVRTRGIKTHDFKSVGLWQQYVRLKRDMKAGLDWRKNNRRSEANRAVLRFLGILCQPSV
jgi:hypothetical protein